MADTDYMFKVLVIGDEGTGKTALLNRYAVNTFTEAYISTVGVDFRIKSAKCNGKTIKAQIWDTAGQEKFRTFTLSYYRGCHGAIIVFDVTYRPSFKQVENWITELKTYGPESVPKLLVGNKCDLTNERCVTTEEAKSMAVIKNMSYIETSAKTNTNVEDTFETLYNDMLKNVSNQAAPPENISRLDEEGVPGETEGMSSEKGDVAVEAESVASVNSENTPPWVNEILEGLNKFGTRLEVVDKLESTVATMSKRLDELEIKVQNMTKEK
ncbi:ras-related protein ORAB-1-like isoform X1 [Mercenaria mercenaria]|uniref:ras-related protein ORAB-1-like isoform X1 n=1 Tax=Mercenaria mercenaria TaxID=6596 RepID=UPI00234E43E9|nr:ras-related protein ORAB-1-like isoform X1 [Mercenaria mercenaria]